MLVLTFITQEHIKNEDTIKRKKEVGTQNNRRKTRRKSLVEVMKLTEHIYKLEE